MVNHKLSLVWGFPIFIVFDCVAHGRSQILAGVGSSVFIIFVRVASHGQSQILISVELTQARPNNDYSLVTLLHHTAYGYTSLIKSGVVKTRAER